MPLKREKWEQFFVSKWRYSTGKNGRKTKICGEANERLQKAYNHGRNLNGLQHPVLFVGGVSSWQQAQVSANWRHSVSGAQCNDKEKQPNKTLIHCTDLKSPLTFVN